MIKVHEIHDLSDERIKNMLFDSFSKITDKNIIKNYNPEFIRDPANIFYILSDENGRYKRGSYYVVEDSGSYVCSAGWNEYDLNRNIALALTRAYVDPKYRTQYYMGKYILPEIIKSTEMYQHLYITSNNYNDTIYQWFVRAEQGKSPGMFNDWPEIYRKFKPIGKQDIYYTEQYVVEYQR